MNKARKLGSRVRGNDIFEFVIPAKAGTQLLLAASHP